MATFVVYNEKDNTHQEILQVRLIISTVNKHNRYRFEKKINHSAIKVLPLRDFYEVSMENTYLIEQEYKKVLLELVKEQRNRKVSNHRAQTSNITLAINEKEAFSLREVFSQLWKVKDNEIEEKINAIQFPLIGNGKTYDCIEVDEYLI